MSDEKFYAYVICHGVDYTIAPGCGSVGLTEEQYDQLCRSYGDG